MNDQTRKARAVAPGKASGVALLLSQLGVHVSSRFAERLTALELTPSQVGVLRLVGQNPGLNQQELAQRLGVAPSRVVKLVDELEQRGIIGRKRSETDRRNYALHIADGAAERVKAVRELVSSHDADVVAGLTGREVQQLRTLLTKVAAAQGLRAEGHPGFGG